jgi:nickel superoxide dismutase
MKLRYWILLLMLVSIIPSLLFAHCQIPCGIYGDKTRIVLMQEHLTTIEKSMKEIERLSSADKLNYNQLVRWINNKDKHADDFTEIVTSYFLAQRIKITESSDKEAYATYQTQVTLLHQMIVYSMKCKQTTDPENVKKLTALLDQFVETYFSKEDIEHLKAHHE